MTDEEMAKQFADGYATPDIEPTLRMHLYECSKESFLAGLNEGKPKWHEVADGDLPKEEAEYLVIFESDGTRYRGLESYYPDEKVWSTICNIIVWCEIPKFEE